MPHRTNAPPADARKRRAPSLDRGHKRVTALLDAATMLIAEEGLGALRLETLARRAGASKSSLYHFFPDRDAVVAALAERSITAFRDFDARTFDSGIDWALLDASHAVDSYLAPFHHFFVEFPDTVGLLRAIGMAGRHAAEESGLDATLSRRAEAVIRARAPRLRPAPRRAAAAVLKGIMFGGMEFSPRLPLAMRAPIIREIRRAMIAYLTALEACAPRGAVRTSDRC